MDRNTPAGNPYNDLPTVRLFDQGGTELALISQRAAARLLRLGQADLILQVPPTVRLCIATADYQALAANPTGTDPTKAQFLHARQGALYGNVHFQNPAGETMFHGDNEKALWYLNRDLVEVVSQNPPILRFKFTPEGQGHVGDPYYLTGKINRCVVCGAVEGLNRHHAVPSVYRRHLPPEVKDHAHHDVLLLCLACHEKYEAAANELKAELGAEFGVPLHGLRGERDRERGRAVKFALALVRHGKQIPQARKEELLQGIREWLKKWPLTDEDIESVANQTADDGEAIEHGRHIIAQLRDIQGFIRRWREHFLRTMQPKFLPEHWDVDRPAFRAPPESDCG